VPAVTPKIPGNCVNEYCRAPLSADTMETWLRACERAGVDPIDRAGAGILCIACLSRAILEGKEDDPLSPEARLFRAMRADQVGLRIVKGEDGDG